MTKQQWRTLSIRINPKTRRACAVQARFPWTQQEWETFMARMEELKPELVKDPDDET